MLNSFLKCSDFVTVDPSAILGKMRPSSVDNKEGDLGFQDLLKELSSRTAMKGRMPMGSAVFGRENLGGSDFEPHKDVSKSGKRGRMIVNGERRDKEGSEILWAEVGLDFLPGEKKEGRVDSVGEPGVKGRVQMNKKIVTAKDLEGQKVDRFCSFKKTDKDAGIEKLPRSQNQHAGKQTPLSDWGKEGVVDSKVYLNSKKLIVENGKTVNGSGESVKGLSGKGLRGKEVGGVHITLEKTNENSGIEQLQGKQGRSVSGQEFPTKQEKGRTIDSKNPTRKKGKVSIQSGEIVKGLSAKESKGWGVDPSDCSIKKSGEMFRAVQFQRNLTGRFVVEESFSDQEKKGAIDSRIGLHSNDPLKGIGKPSIGYGGIVNGYSAKGLDVQAMDHFEFYSEKTDQGSGIEKLQGNMDRHGNGPESSLEWRKEGIIHSMMDNPSKDSMSGKGNATIASSETIKETSPVELEERGGGDSHLIRTEPDSVSEKGAKRFVSGGFENGTMQGVSLKNPSQSSTGFELLTTSMNGGKDFSPPIRDSIIGQIVPSMTRMVQQGRSKVTIVLRPKHFGMLRIELVSGRGILDARFFVESSEVRGLIESSLPELRSALEKEGVQVLNFDVKVAQEFSSHPGHRERLRRETRQNKTTAEKQFEERIHGEDERKDSFSPRYFGYNSIELVI